VNFVGDVYLHRTIGELCYVHEECWRNNDMVATISSLKKIRVEVRHFISIGLCIGGWEDLRAAPPPPAPQLSKTVRRAKGVQLCIVSLIMQPVISSVSWIFISV